jgi:hypothetical protein
MSIPPDTHVQDASLACFIIPASVALTVEPRKHHEQLAASREHYLGMEMHL